jgi:hypothetical protein
MGLVSSFPVSYLFCCAIGYELTDTHTVKGKAPATREEDDEEAELKRLQAEMAI